MKKVLLSATIACVCLFLSCTDNNNNKDKVELSSSASDKAENGKSAILKVYKAIETGDMSGIDSLWTEDMVDHNPPGGKELRGNDSIKAQLMQMHNQIKDLKLEVIASAYDNDYVFTLGHLTGTTLVPMNGLPANSKIDGYAVDVVKMRDGKQAEHWQYVDPNEMMKRMAMPISEKAAKHK